MQNLPAVRIYLMTIVIVTILGIFPVGSALAGAGAPAGFRLPFNGYAEISQGPRCRISHYSGIDREAIDFTFPTRSNRGRGTRVYATQSGWAQSFPNTWPGGNMVKIYHPNGLTSIYAHLQDFGGLNYSGWVRKGQWIGRVGSTGNATGPHLHFAVVRTSNQAPVGIYNMKTIQWIGRNPANPNDWCKINGRIDGKAWY